jgi:transcriptional regulator with PAS, ATPase and Fis domain
MNDAAAKGFSEKDLIAGVLRESEGNVLKAAEKLTISETWTRRKIAEHKLEDLVRE